MAAGQTSLLAFRIADRRFALDAARVAEVVRRPLLTRVPHAPPSLAGVAALRGRVAPVIALGRLLGVDDADVAPERLIVLTGAAPIGLAVDEVLGLETGGAEGLVAIEGGAARVLPLDQLLEEAFADSFRRTAGRSVAPPPARAVIATGQATVALLAFSLAGQPYAVPLEYVREVIATPAEIAVLPRSDAAMLGLATWRGALMPIVSTRALLGLPPAPLTASAQVVVANVGDARIGLAVDEVSAIVRAPASAIGPVPRVLNRGAGEARVTAMLRTGTGGLVSVLEPERLFAEESVAQILEDGRDAAEADVESASTAFHRFVIFELAGETYGLDIAAVEEVAALPEQLSRVPRAPAYVLGVMNLRGAAVPVIDQRRRFGVESATAAARPRVIVTRIGDQVAGFAVDAVTQILELPADRLAPTPELTQDAARLFDRVAQIEDSGRVILLVNPQELLDQAERDLVAALAKGAAPA
jgi:purine-binding chemotaxis protein CheW